jgi:hypothetical protein
MQTTDYARTRSVAPTQLKITHQLRSFVEGSEQKVFDLGLTLLQRSHPGIGVGESVLDLGDISLEFGAVGFELALAVGELPLIGAQRVHCREHCSVVGLAGLQSGHSRLKLLQRRHRPSLSCALDGTTAPSNRGGAK